MEAEIDGGGFTPTCLMACHTSELAGPYRKVPAGRLDSLPLKVALSLLLGIGESSAVVIDEQGLAEALHIVGIQPGAERGHVLDTAGSVGLKI